MAPRPKPTAILRLEGSRRANGRTHEPVLPVADRDPPAHLYGAGLEEWHRLVGPLIDSGVLTIADRGALAAACHTYGRWVEAEAKVRELGLVIMTANGCPQVNPHLSIANESLRQYRAFAIELGITPAARSRVKAEIRPASRDGFEQYLNKRKP